MRLHSGETPTQMNSPESTFVNAKCTHNTKLDGAQHLMSALDAQGSENKDVKNIWQECGKMCQSSGKMPKTTNKWLTLYFSSGAVKPKFLLLEKIGRTLCIKPLTLN